MLIEGTSIEDLKALTGPRREMMFALAHVCRRKDGFEDAEAALFRLAVAENESYANNATGVWKMLFLGRISLTHRPFAARLNILKERLKEDSEFRLMAVEGLEAAAGFHMHGPSFSEADKVDGEWPEVSGDDFLHGQPTGTRRRWQLPARRVTSATTGRPGKRKYCSEPRHCWPSL